MAMPREVYDVLAAVARKFIDLHRSANDDDRREATRRAVATIRARIHGSGELDGSRWVHKAAGPGNPPSKDAIAFVPDGDIRDRLQTRMFMFDTVNGATREPNAFPLIGSDGAQWIIMVEDHDWLNGGGQPDATHKYDGGGNDTNICDICGKSRFDPVHAIPESKTKHAYDGGEQDTGLCDICQKTPGDAIHDLAPDPGNGGTVDKHDFVAAKFNPNICSLCGLPKTDPVHQTAQPQPGTMDLRETNDLLRQVVAQQAITNTKIDGLRSSVIDAVKTLGDLLPTILNIITKKTAGDAPPDETQDSDPQA